MNYDMLYEKLPYLQEAEVSITENPWDLTFVINSGNPERKLTEFEKIDLSKTLEYLWKSETGLEFKYAFKFTEIDSVPMEVESYYPELPLVIDLDSMPVEGE